MSSNKLKPRGTNQTSVQVKKTIKTFNDIIDEEFYYINKEYSNYSDSFNSIIDKIYIISLKKCTKKRQLCIEQLNYLHITNYKIFDAINTITRYRYDNLYNLITSTMSSDKVKYDFQKGALGCLLSHLEVIKDAKKNGYKNILVLEDDILINKTFWEKYRVIENSISKVDFLYLGKKQLLMGKHNINIYKPNTNTFASHAWLINSTMYDILIETYTKFKQPVDMSIFNLFDNYKFGVVNEDLFITTEESDIREQSVSTYLFNWNMKNYFSGKNRNIKNIIIYGFKYSDHTHRYIHNQYYEFFKFYYPNLNVYWFDENEDINKNFDNSIFFMSPCHRIYNKILFNLSSLYIFHLDNFDDNIGYKTIESCLQIPFYRNLVHSNKAAILISREMPETNNMKYFEKDITKNIICLPWFGNTFYKEIKNSTKNYEIISSKKYLCYLGSVWYLNEDIIQKLIDLCIKKGIYLLIKGRIKINIKLVTNDSEYIKIIRFNYQNNDENSLEYLDSVYGIKGLLTIQGDEHNNTYMSNRIIECITSGYPAITNNLLASTYYKSVYYSPNIEDLLDYYVNLVNNRDLWEQTLQKQKDEVLEKFYGYHNITTLLDFVKDVNMKNNELISYYENTNRANQLYFVQNGYSNKFYIKCSDINDLFINKKSYTIDASMVETCDIFLLEQVIKMYDYYVYIHDEYMWKDQIINICNKLGKEYKIRKNVEKVCLLSSQRTGSTLFIDYIQKTSDKVLALSEIFLLDEGNPTYTTSFDATTGILKNVDITEYTIENITEYFQQFIDYAEFNDYEVLVYKVTHEFFYNNMFRVLDFNNIMTFIQRSKIIYLDRDSKDIFISKKLADKNNSYSNDIYKENIDTIDEDEYNQFLTTKSDFENEYVNSNFYIYNINYSSFIENDHKHNIDFINKTLNDLLDTDIEYLEYKTYFEDFNIFNKKQNKFYK